MVAFRCVTALNVHINAVFVTIQTGLFCHIYFLEVVVLLVHAYYFLEIIELHQQDSFTRCFKSNPPEPWNWNVYLFPLWCLGVVIRYGILFTARVVILAAGWVVFLSSFIPVHFLLKGHDKLRRKLEVNLVTFFVIYAYTSGPQTMMLRSSLLHIHLENICRRRLQHF
ncbi:glycerol-3-phosphate acyltransferase 9-like [Magnolia sinica]|uniref:glycerol-3-phosphate acyltransferase 9-like n=1 Tax=Magnolia sinica TaxID=86752 RepID=UPI00265B6BB7|nr:glycerol-3-phosphate acyltransferase 9-like [Magnolia sinica]